ncbi:MAG: hypothetical protein K2O60_04175 [Ruminococcus sp.]|nr:hypothetical protein [Ruminococcus sp.]
MNLHEIMLAKQLAGENGGGNADLSDYYTKSQTDSLIAEKVDKETGKGLSTNDFTNADKSKLDGLENYDDTDVKDDIVESKSQAAINRTTLGYQRKNLLKNVAKSKTINGVTFTVNEDFSVTANGIANETATFFLNSSPTITGLSEDKTYILSGCDGGSDDTFFLRYNNQGTSKKYNDVYDGDLIVKYADATCNFAIIVKQGTTINKTFYPMLRYAEITDDTYEPYKPSVQEQIDDITDQVFGAGKVIPNGADLNNYTTTGVYNCLNRGSSETLINNPYKLRGFRLEVVQTTAASTSFITQRLYPNAGEDGVFFLRRWDGVGVGNWYKFVGEAVTTT